MLVQQDRYAATAGALPISPLPASQAQGNVGAGGAAVEFHRSSDVCAWPAFDSRRPDPVAPIGRCERDRWRDSVSFCVSRLALDDKHRNVQAEVMSSSAMWASLAKRARRDEAETVWL